MRITPLKLMAAGLVLAIVLLSVLVARGTQTAGGKEGPVVADGVLTLVVVGKLNGWQLFRVDDHSRGVTCYTMGSRGGMDCDRSFYRRVGVQ